MNFRPYRQPEPGLVHCTANGCDAQTETPWADNWIFHDWDGFAGIASGFYCNPHGEAIETFTWGPDGIGWDLPA